MCVSEKTKKKAEKGSCRLQPNTTLSSSSDPPKSICAHSTPKPSSSEPLRFLFAGGGLGRTDFFSNRAFHFLEVFSFSDTVSFVLVISLAFFLGFVCGFACLYVCWGRGGGWSAL